MGRYWVFIPCATFAVCAALAQETIPPVPEAVPVAQAKIDHAKVLKLLLDRLKNGKTPAMRQQAAGELKSLRESGKATPEVVLSAFGAALEKEEDVLVQKALIKHIDGFGEKAEVAVPGLIAALKSKDQDVRAAAAHLLGDIGPKAKTAINPLIQALSDAGKAEHVRCDSSCALARIGAASIPAVVKALKSSNKKVRYWAAFTLETLGPKAKSAIPALEQTLRDEQDAQVRTAAEEALKQIKGE